MIRPLAGFAVLVLVVGGASGCARGNELKTAYNGCLDNFSDRLPEEDAQLDVGDAEDYLSYEDDRLTVTTSFSTIALATISRGAGIARSPVSATRASSTSFLPWKPSATTSRGVTA